VDGARTAILSRKTRPGPFAASDPRQQAAARCSRPEVRADELDEVIASAAPRRRWDEVTSGASRHCRMGLRPEGPGLDR